jgi:hypothetical protein
VRQAHIIKDRALVKRDVEDIAAMDSLSDFIPLKLMNPLRIVDGKLKVQAPTLLSTVSLLR